MTLPQGLLNGCSENSGTILLETVLQLLSERLKKLAHSGFFAPELDKYVGQLRSSVLSLQEQMSVPPLDLPLIAEVTESIWRATQFLTGTTSNRVPYEVTFLLREVLLDWELGDSIVTTSLNQSPDFYCERTATAPDALVKQLNIPGLSVSGHLVQMGVPEVFHHMPLLCSPLYHEVGHYIEERDRLVASHFMSYEREFIDAIPSLREFAPEHHPRVAKAYAIEHFCDLVAASYVGECVSDYIIQWDHETVPQETHPTAADRFEVTRDFLEGKSNPLIELLKGAVATSGLNVRLEKCYMLPEVTECFADVRPAAVESIPQLHGLLPAADAFLKQLRATPSTLKDTNIARVPRSQHAHLVNDLIEKSIRNFMIVKAWDESLDKKADS
jgi:hypothetical protein